MEPAEARLSVRQEASNLQALSSPPAWCLDRWHMRRRPPLVAQEGEGELARRDQAAPLLGGRLC